VASRGHRHVNLQTRSLRRPDHPPQLRGRHPFARYSAPHGMGIWSGGSRRADLHACSLRDRLVGNRSRRADDQFRPHPSRRSISSLISDASRANPVRVPRQFRRDAAHLYGMPPGMPPSHGRRRDGRPCPATACARDLRVARASAHSVDVGEGWLRTGAIFTGGMKPYASRRGHRRNRRHASIAASTRLSAWRNRLGRVQVASWAASSAAAAASAA
jgi:hypothetical protein